MHAASFAGGDGTEIFYRCWQPVGPARGCVLIAHGASEHSGRYARFAELLRRAGFAVYALDQRGHGRTGEKHGPGRLGPAGRAGLLGDLQALEGIARAAAPGVPIALFGHSMGSVIAQAYAERHGDGLSALVLSGSLGAVDGPSELLASLEAAVAAGQADEPVDLLGSFNAAFEPARTKYDWLSRDPREVDAYLADRFCGDAWPLTFATVAEVMRMADEAMREESIARIPGRLPVLLITGEADPASDMARQVRELERRLRAARLPVTAYYYPEARHELLNETNRDAVQADVVAWLERVLAG